MQGQVPELQLYLQRKSESDQLQWKKMILQSEWKLIMHMLQMSLTFQYSNTNGRKYGDKFII